MIDSSCTVGKIKCPNGKCIDQGLDIKYCYLSIGQKYRGCNVNEKWCSVTGTCELSHFYDTLCSKCGPMEKKCLTGRSSCIARHLFCQEEECNRGLIKCGFECLVQSEICRREINNNCESYVPCTNTDGATKRIYYIICLVLPITLLFLVCSIMLKKYRSASRTTVVIDAPVEQLPLGRLEDGRISSRTGGVPILVATPGVQINVNNESRLDPPAYEEVVDDRLPTYEDILLNSNSNSQRTNPT